SYSELQTGLETLLAQELPLQISSEMENQLQELRVKAIEVVSQADGLKIPDIAKVLGISTDLAKLVVKPLVGDVIRMKGVKRGAKYYKK
ncbi:MAG: hypothetical protein Q8K40_00810, partial [Ignavibacteria bacterium]|nr:hypothetical protein [Ignavibacteria bacterium]